MRLTLKISALMAWFLFGAGMGKAQAAQVLNVKVTKDDASFHIAMHIVINAASLEVFRALQDYGAMRRYNSDLRSVAIEPTTDPNRLRLVTTIHTCVLFFCKTLHQQQVMTATANSRGGVLHAELVPESGAFSGEARWAVSPCGVKASPACLEVQIELVPRFWVAPLIGSWVIRRKMYEEAQLTSAGLEQLAQASISRGQ